MKSEEYSKFVEETSKETLEKVSQEIEKFGKKEPSLEQFSRTYFKERMSRPWAQRCSVIRASYEAVAPGRDWREMLDSMTGTELWFMADHLTNDIFDNKFERNPNLTTKYGKDVNLYFIASAVLREKAEKCFRESARKTNPTRENEVVEIFGQIVEDAYMHQWLDYYELKKDKVKFEELSKRKDELFKKRYIDYEAGNQFGKIVKIPAVLTEAPEEQKTALENYGRCLSTTIQLTNDIADLGDEWFFDRRNGILTLPLIDVSLEIGKYCYDLPQEEVRRIFVEKGLFKEEKNLIYHYINKAKKHLREVFEKQRRAALETLLVSSVSNRFYKILPQYDKTYKVMPPQI